MKNAFYFMLKALFVLDMEAKYNFKIYGVTDWTTNNYNSFIVQHLKK